MLEQESTSSSQNSRCAVILDEFANTGDVGRCQICVSGVRWQPAFARSNATRFINDAILRFQREARRHVNRRILLVKPKEPRCRDCERLYRLRHYTATQQSFSVKRVASSAIWSAKMPLNS